MKYLSYGSVFYIVYTDCDFFISWEDLVTVGCSTSCSRETKKLASAVHISTFLNKGYVNRYLRGNRKFNRDLLSMLNLLLYLWCLFT
jgi:hypothetical protein